MKPVNLGWLRLGERRKGGRRVKNVRPATSAASARKVEDRRKVMKCSGHMDTITKLHAELAEADRKAISRDQAVTASWKKALSEADISHNQAVHGFLEEIEKLKGTIAELKAQVESLKSPRRERPLMRAKLAKKKAAKPTKHKKEKP